MASISQSLRSVLERAQKQDSLGKLINEALVLIESVIDILGCVSGLCNSNRLLISNRCREQAVAISFNGGKDCMFICSWLLLLFLMANRLTIHCRYGIAAHLCRCPVCPTYPFPPIPSTSQTFTKYNNTPAAISYPTRTPCTSASPPTFSASMHASSHHPTNLQPLPTRFTPSLRPPPPTARPPVPTNSFNLYNSSQPVC